jgi:3-oxoadipate enol-lactonase/4-carboxymuconolactone decarboxylase
VTPAIAAARLTGTAHRAELPVLVLGPSLGTSAATLWGACAAGLADAFDLVAWDLPGHGYNRAVPEEPFTVAELAAGVLSVVDDVLTGRGEPGARFWYAGVSVGGAVGLQLLLDAPARVAGAALLCTGARIGTPESWAERVAQLGASGTAGLVPDTAKRWFAPAFLDREPDRGAALLRGLADVADEGYAQVCGALAGFDVRDRLDRVAAPVLAVAGAEDAVTPAAGLEEVARGVRRGTLVVLDGVAHLAPAEAPERVTRLLRHHFLGEPLDSPELTTGLAHELRELHELHELHEVHELHGGQATTGPRARDAVWERPGLDVRTRAVVALAAAVAGGRHDDLATDVRAALDHGLSAEEVREVLLQAAVGVEVADADAAFRIAEQALEDR